MTTAWKAIPPASPERCPGCGHTDHAEAPADHCHAAIDIDGQPQPCGCPPVEDTL